LFTEVEIAKEHGIPYHEFLKLSEEWQVFYKLQSTVKSEYEKNEQQKMKKKTK